MVCLLSSLWFCPRFSLRSFCGRKWVLFVAVVNYLRNYCIFTSVFNRRRSGSMCISFFTHCLFLNSTATAAGINKSGSTQSHTSCADMPKYMYARPYICVRISVKMHLMSTYSTTPQSNDLTALSSTAAIGLH